MRAFFSKLLLVTLPMIFLAGCIEAGKVDQGRTVAFDKEAKTVTIICDKSIDASKPDYSILPAVTFKIPVNPMEMGPEPKAGLRMKLDADKGQVVLYNLEKKNFDTVSVQIIDKQEGIDKNHPLVKDKTFPAIDKDKKTVTIYSGRQKLLVTFVVPEAYLDLPPMAWDAGDEVRIYFKVDGTALRLMNVTRTDIFKK